jgi:hypothetical protein
MNVHKLSHRLARPARTRHNDRRPHRAVGMETLGLDLLDVMIDLDPGMLVWSGSERSRSARH